jgi:hypothetical protein
LSAYEKEYTISAKMARRFNAAGVNPQEKKELADQSTTVSIF